MVNVSTKKRNIVAGKDLCLNHLRYFFSRCDFVDGVSEHNETKHGMEWSKIPEHLRNPYESSIQNLHTEEQKRKVYDMLRNNSNLFSKGQNDIGRELAL